MAERESRTVRQLRLVVEADDYEVAVAFYRDVLGLPEEEAFEGAGGAHVTILDVGRATLELANPAQKRMIDDVEVGRQVAPRLRVAFEVDDTTAVTERLGRAGATVVAPPTRTPWSRSTPGSTPRRASTSPSSRNWSRPRFVHNSRGSAPVALTDRKAVWVPSRPIACQRRSRMWVRWDT